MINVRHIAIVAVLLVLIGCGGTPPGKAETKALAESLGLKATTVTVSDDLKDIAVDVDMSKNTERFISTQMARLVLDTVDQSAHLTLRLYAGPLLMYRYDTDELERDAYRQYLDMVDFTNETLYDVPDRENIIAERFGMPYDDVLSTMSDVEHIIVQQQR
jgi:hypothetical protein